MTSLVFMFRLVPAPPWKASMGNWSRHRPLSRTWSQAQMIALVISSSSVPNSRLARAEAFLTWTMPRMKEGSSPIVAPEMRKFSWARRVWIPQ